MWPIIERLDDLMPRHVDGLLADGERAGSRIVHRLVDEWANGVNRFDRPGEVLFGAWVDRRLIGICGLNIDPYAGDDRIGRVRHLYVSSGCRRHGVGRQLVAHLVRTARGRFDVLRLRTNDPAAARLYEAVGFDACSDAEAYTHVANLAARASTVELRPYRTEDEEAVVVLWWYSWHSIRHGLRHPQPLADWRTRWANEIAPRQAIVVVEDDGVVIGFAVADLPARVLTQIFVAPERKRDGIGRQLLGWAQRSMPAGFRLRTLEDNLASRAFYERHGLTAGDIQSNPVNGMSTIEYRWTPA